MTERELIRANWRRFAWRLVGVALVAGGILLGIGFGRNNPVLTMLGGIFLAHALWMTLWTLVDDVA